MAAISRVDQRPEEIGWTASETWETGLQKTIQWYQENPTWIEDARSGAYREYYAKQYGIEAGR